MKFSVFVATFLAAAIAVQAGNPQNAIQLSASAQDDQADEIVTPQPTTFDDIPTPAPTNSSDPTPAPTFPTAALTESADSYVTPAPTTSSNSDDGSQSERTSAGIVGVAYSSEGAVGVAYATTRAEYESAKSSNGSSGSGATVPIVVVGCLVGVLGVVAAAVIVRKRKDAAEEEGETEYTNANTPAATVKGETAFDHAVQTPAVADEDGETDYSNAIHTPVAV